MTKTICARHRKIKGRRLVESDFFTLGRSRPLGKKTAGSDPPAAVASDVVILDRHPGIILALVVQLAASLHHPGGEGFQRETKKHQVFLVKVLNKVLVELPP